MAKTPLGKTAVRAATSDNVKTATITSIATVFVAALGIVPTYLKWDRDYESIINQKTLEIEKLSNENKSLKPTYAIRGSVLDSINHTAIKDAVVYVADADAQTALDDNGTFVVNNTFRKSYLLVMERPGGRVTRLLINPSEPVGEAAGVDIRYTFDGERQP
jgi:hypothetical protein